ncbi:unnamed protein product [Cuscuta europaea]|uniref:Uncharacterized protein n=1 Tax=Cuscuta europaea TaxID=41803 RepID=A0A9P1EA51_CUSEU|nr:unnamed protein product [Cuscuta europaea]
MAIVGCNSFEQGRGLGLGSGLDWVVADGGWSGGLAWRSFGEADGGRCHKEVAGGTAENFPTATMAGGRAVTGVGGRAIIVVGVTVAGFGFCTVENIPASTIAGGQAVTGVSGRAATVAGVTEIVTGGGGSAGFGDGGGGAGAGDGAGAGVAATGVPVPAKEYY